MKDLSRVEKFRQKIESSGKIPYLISDMGDVLYLSGFTGSIGYIFITDGENIFITDGRYEEQCKIELNSCWRVEIVSSYRDYFEKLSKLFQKVYVTDKLPLNLYLDLSKNTDVVVDDFSEIMQMRMIKDDLEIKMIKHAYQIAADAMMKSLSGFVLGKTEREWAAILEYNMKLSGADKESFDTIVASGYRGAMPHGRASDKTINIFEPVIIDYGAKAHYVSDVTRMVYMGDDKKVLDHLKIISDTVDYCIDLIMPGEICSEIYQKSKRYLEKYKLDEYFNHGLGHSIGIDVHEKPSLSRYDDTIITEGMVFTVEPGIYFPDKYGIRMEETVLVKKNGCEIISSVLKDRLLKL